MTGLNGLLLRKRNLIPNVITWGYGEIGYHYRFAFCRSGIVLRYLHQIDYQSVTNIGSLTRIPSSNNKIGVTNNGLERQYHLILWGRAEVARQAHNLEVGGSIPSPATASQ